MSVKPIPDNYPTLTPYLVVRGAARAIEFYKQVFGAVERFRIPGPEGKVGHAELELGTSLIMLADEHPEMGIVGPQGNTRPPVGMHVYVEDVDAVFARALAAGATQAMPVEQKFYGDRTGAFHDPFGHFWSVATHVEDVSPEELTRRASQFGKGPA